MLTLPEIFDYWGRFRPDREAVICDDARYDWRDLRRAARGVAAELQRRGVTPGDRVAILLPNCAEWVIAYLGLTYAGAVLVPLNVRFGRFELRAIEADAGCSAIITASAHGQSLADRFDLGAGNAETILIASPLTAAIPPICLGNAIDTALEPASIPRDPEALCAIFYTSGSTGLPKGTMQTHASVMAYIWSFATGLTLTSEDRVLIVAPLAFTGGCLSLLIPLLVIGGCCIIERGYDPERLLKLAETERVTFMSQVPAIWDRLPQLPGWQAADFSALRVALAGGAPVPVSLLETFRSKGVAIRQCYGATEIGSMGCFPPTALSMARPETVGFPLPTLDARVVANGSDCRSGEVGELWFKGPQVMKGYWRNPEATAAAFDDGFYKTGDLVARAADGSITIVDRQKNMIISGGVNIYPAEIERALLSLDIIAECGVFGVADAQWGERVVALVHGAGAIDLDALMTDSRMLLGPLKTPREIVVAPEPLPKTVTNKIARTELPALYRTLTGLAADVKENTL